MLIWHINAMELKHLRYFRAAVEEGSLQAAAARLNVAQPALSRRVRDFEAFFGCELLARGTRGVIPTKAGLALYQDTARVLVDLDEAVQRARRIGLEQGRDVRMGLAPTSARKYTFLNNAFNEFSSNAQHSGIAFVRASSSILADNLREGAVDVALLYEQRPGSSQIAEQLVHREAYVLAVHPSHRLALPGPADLTDLQGQPLIWLARSDIADSLNPLLLQLRRHGFDPAIAQVVDSPDEQIDITIASAGICLTPASTILTISPDKLRFRALPRLDAAMDFTLAWRREGAGEIAARLVDCLRVAIDRHQAVISAQAEGWVKLGGHPLYQLA